MELIALKYYRLSIFIYRAGSCFDPFGVVKSAAKARLEVSIVAEGDMSGVFFGSTPLTVGFERGFIICASYWLSDSLLSPPSSRWLNHVLRSSRQMGQRLSRSAIIAQQRRQAQCVQRVGTPLFMGPSQMSGFSWHAGHSSVLSKFQRRSHS